MVVWAGLAAAGAIEAGHGLAAADVERLAEDVLAAVFDGFDAGHETPVRLQYPTFWGEDAMVRRRPEEAACGWLRSRASFVLIRRSAVRASHE
jgi:hypothetical protein